MVFFKKHGDLIILSRALVEDERCIITITKKSFSDQRTKELRIDDITCKLLKEEQSMAARMNSFPPRDAVKLINSLSKKDRVLYTFADQFLL